jgi:hypothetical protein
MIGPELSVKIMASSANGATAQSATANGDGLDIHSLRLKILLAIAFLFPVLLCALLLPSPASDLREHINFGLTYRLEGFAAPPLQTWLAGAVALTGARDAWLYIFVGQVLNFVGLVYLILTARRFIGEEAVVPLALMFCGTVFYTLAMPTMVLNADQIQVPLWAGILFHGLMALRDDRWRDWVLLGLLVGLTVLAKYTVLLLVAVLLVTLALMPAYRKTFLNPKLYVAGLCALPFIALHAIPEWTSGHSVDYAGVQFRSWASVSYRLDALWNLIRSYLLYGAPFLAALGLLAWKGQIVVKGIPQAPLQRFLLIGTALYFLTIVVLIFGFGLSYGTRHTYPLFGVSLLALLTVVRIEPAGTRPFADVLLAIWAAVIVGTVVYSQVGRHGLLQEPGPSAAALLREEWNKRFSCGPAYIIGTDRNARLIAINYGKPVLGLAFEDTARQDWFDKQAMANQGAIILTLPDQAGRADLAHWFKGRSMQTLALPYRRTRRTDQHTYAYAFVPPDGCPPRAAASPPGSRADAKT